MVNPVREYKLGLRGGNIVAFEFLILAVLHLCVLSYRNIFII
jgi:hypothetical protein